jgi:FAD:protein FMN transferase
VSRVDRRFRSMGGEARIRLESAALSESALEALAASLRARIDAVAAALTRFDPASDLCALNRDLRRAAPAPPVVVALARAAAWAHERSGGLVDATLLEPLEACGYERSRAGAARAPLADALAVAPPRRPAAARGPLGVGVRGELVLREPGVRLDSGGLGKGMAADLAAAMVPAGVRYAIACGGDLAVGAEEGAPWGVAVAGVAGGEVHRLRVDRGGIATSGIHARLWRRPDGTYAHHLLDPATGAPAWTGVVAATAVAPTALEAEVLAKTAVLSGPRRARRVLAAGGGVLQLEDGSVEVVQPRRVVTLATAAA